MEAMKTVEVLSENRTAFLEAVRNTTLDYWIAPNPSLKTKESAESWAYKCLTVFSKARLIVRRASFNSF